MATEEVVAVAAQGDEAPLLRPRTPLIIGCIALGLIAWMFLVIILLIAWKLFR